MDSKKNDGDPDLFHCKPRFLGDTSQLVCGGCHRILMYARGATNIRCSCCNTINHTSSVVRWEAEIDLPSQKWKLMDSEKMDGSSWVLEYTRSALYDGPSIHSSAIELLRLKSTSMLKLLKHEPWRLLPLGIISDASYHYPGEKDYHFLRPT